MTDSSKILSAMARFGVRVQRYPGWERRNHGALDSHTIAVHDSVTGHMSAEQAAKFCIAGRAGLAGPLYECLIGMDGTVHLIANGITYNSGKGNEGRAWMARRGEMPLDRELGSPPAGEFNGNGWSHGVAMVTYGAGPYTREQLEACARACAAYGIAEGWGENTAGSTIGHGEFSRRKVDPLTDMGAIRRRIDAIIKGSVETWHIVVNGDTLWSLARRYGVTVAQLRTWNDLRSDMIGIGWRLRVK